MNERSQESTHTSKYLGIYSDLIKLAAQMAMGEGVPDWSERVFSTGTPSYERRDMLSALRAADEAGITHALQLRAIADRLSAEIRSSNETFEQPLAETALRELAFHAEAICSTESPSDMQRALTRMSITRAYKLLGVTTVGDIEANAQKAVVVRQELQSDVIRDLACCDKFLPESASEFCAECGYTYLDHLCKRAKEVGERP